MYCPRSLRRTDLVQSSFFWLPAPYVKVETTSCFPYRLLLRLTSSSTTFRLHSRSDAKCTTLEVCWSYITTGLSSHLHLFLRTALRSFYYSWTPNSEQNFATSFCVCLAFSAKISPNNLALTFYSVQVFNYFLCSMPSRIYVVSLHSVATSRLKAFAFSITLQSGPLFLQKSVAVGVSDYRMSPFQMFATTPSVPIRLYRKSFLYTFCSAFYQVYDSQLL